MEIHLVRHACAGRKEDWDGPDADRPLDPVGIAQAAALDQMFADHPPTRVVSSPTRRCAQTLEPLARRHGLPVETAAELRTDVEPGELLHFLATCAEAGAVLCTHGEAMTALLPWLPVDGEVDRDELLAKGVLWTLTVEDGEGPRVTSLRHRLPASLRPCASHSRQVSSSS